MNPGMRFLEFYWMGVCIIQLWVSTLWVHTLHMCTVSQNLILFANGFPGSRVWVWSRGPQWVCKEYFCKFCLSIGRMRSQQADNSDNTDWNPTLCPPHAPTGRTPSPLSRGSRVACLGKGRACFSAKLQHLVSWLPALLLERPSANVLRTTWGSSSVEWHPKVLHEGFFTIFLCPGWGCPLC